MVTLSRRAVSDLDDIYDFHHVRNPRFATALVTRLSDAIRSLAQHPKRGTNLPTAPHFRRLVESDHVIVYAARGDDVVIVRVLHGARDIEALLSNETPWPV